MKAWRFHGPGDMRLDEVAEPMCGPRDVVLRVRVVEFSVTEAILARGHETVGIDRVRTRLQSAPVQLFGHEYTGEVVEVGSDVTRLAVGDRTANRSLLPCMACTLCATGRDDDCRRGPSTGIDFPGMLAEYGRVPEYALVPLPREGVSDFEAASMQPAAECVAAVDSAHIGHNDVVVVLGLGAMGIYSMQAARHSLAREVIAVDVRPEPLARARELGADHTIDASTADPVNAVMELTRGIGADVVIEAAGGPPREGLSGSKTLDDAFAMARDCGRVVVNSLIPGLTGLDLLRWRMKSMQLVFPEMADLGHLRTTVAMVAQGRMRIDPMISHIVWGLDQAPLALEITADRGRFGATGPCQIVVDTESVARDPRVLERPAVVV